MILKDSFYRIIKQESTSESIIADIKINSEHSIFKGHFPNNPITPGVIQLEIVKELISLGMDKKLLVSKMGNCKFLAVLNPLLTPIVNAVISIKNLENSSVSISAILKNEKTIFLKFSASYRLI